MLKGIFRTKNLNDILSALGDETHQLKRSLGPLSITLLGIGAIIGAGIFATVGTAAAGDASRPGAGPSLMLSFVITAVVCAFTALCYAEMAAMVPISGSAYTYSYATLGELVAWIIGWDLMLEYAIGNVAVAISWANYFRSFIHDAFGINIPDWLATDFRTAAKIPGLREHAPHLFGYPIVFNILAFGIVAAITVLLVWGIKESAEFNAAMVVVKIVVLLFFIGGSSGQVFTRMIEVFYQTAANRLSSPEDDGDGVCRGLGSFGGGSARCHNDVNFHRGKFRRRLRQLFRVPTTVAKFEVNVFSLYVASITQSGPE